MLVGIGNGNGNGNGIGIGNAVREAQAAARLDERRADGMSSARSKIASSRTVRGGATSGTLRERSPVLKKS
jgi:hypothetical protein